MRHPRLNLSLCPLPSSSTACMRGALARARGLAARYGERFASPALLVEKAGKGERFS